MTERAAEAIYDITGERITSLAGWQKWYRDEFPAWIKRRQPK